MVKPQCLIYRIITAVFLGFPNFLNYYNELSTPASMFLAKHPNGFSNSTSNNY